MSTRICILPAFAAHDGRGVDETDPTTTGVLVQDNVELTGPSGHHSKPPYQPHP